jgi:hypothetical protein
MSIISGGRAVLRLQYEAASLPLRIVEQRIVGRYLGGDSGVHLALERFVSSMDSTAGRLLGDSELVERGRRGTRYADALDRAVHLEQSAEQRRTSADQMRQGREHDAKRRRQEALDSERKRVTKAAQRVKTERKQAEEGAEQKIEDGKRSADQRAAEQRARAKTEQQAQEKRIAARTEQQTAGPKRQLKQGGQEKAEAEREQRDAEKLAQLADRERASRGNPSSAPG